MDERHGGKFGPDDDDKTEGRGIMDRLFFAFFARLEDKDCVHCCEVLAPFTLLIWCKGNLKRKNILTKCLFSNIT